MSKVNIGIIGAGMIGDVHFENIRKDGRGEVTWIELAGGGPFYDWGVYDFSFHLGLLNDVPQLTDIKSFTKKQA